MRDILRQKLARMLEEERRANRDEALLNRLVRRMAADTLYWDLPPETRVALNEFIRSLQDCLMAQLIAGGYGASIIIEALLVNAFEVGYRTGREEKLEQG